MSLKPNHIEALSRPLIRDAVRMFDVDATVCANYLKEINANIELDFWRKMILAARKVRSNHYQTFLEAQRTLALIDSRLGQPAGREASAWLAEWLYVFGDKLGQDTQHLLQHIIAHFCDRWAALTSLHVADPSQSPKIPVDCLEFIMFAGRCNIAETLHVNPSIVGRIAIGENIINLTPIEFRTYWMNEQSTREEIPSQKEYTQPYRDWLSPTESDAADVQLERLLPHLAIMGDAYSSWLDQWL